MSVCVSLVFVRCGSLCVTSVALYVNETCFSAIGCSQLVEWREKETVKAWRQLFPTQKHKAGTREVFPFATTCYIAHLTAHCAHVHVTPHQKKKQGGYSKSSGLDRLFQRKTPCPSRPQTQRNKDLSTRGAWLEKQKKASETRSLSVRHMSAGELQVHSEGK